MQSGEMVPLVAGVVLPLLVAVPAVTWFRRRRRDEIFEGVTPGELPAYGQQVTRRRVGGDEWSGTVAVRFTPPDGLTPGLVGTVIDGRANVVDVSATLVDLAVRGYLHLHAEPADPDRPPPPPRGPNPKPARASTTDHDWRLTRLPTPEHDTLLPFERALLDAVFARSTEVTIADLKARGFDLTMREAQIGLYREVVDRGWYTKHPRDRNRRLGCLGWPLAIVAIVLALASLARTLDPVPSHTLQALGAGLFLSAILLIWGGRGRTPRTAEGTAVRIQALGFQEYLTKAEANQIRFEEASDLFSRYLPYAMVFGVADRWAATFAQVARQAQLQGLGSAWFDLTWIDGLTVLDGLSDLGEVAFGMADVLGDLPGLDLPDLDIADGLGSIASGATDFADSASGLLDFGDGCGGCDGCDLGL
ncbi:MAG: DUF2207 domain-containing protein [Actinobacteria bacterium]|nr:DUF2207 domain-containing protein [Actinomycetota bacterium]